MKKRPNLNVSLVVVFLAILLPFALAVLFSGDEHVFIGFLVNPKDSVTYLAKMYQGWEGTWRFHLPYTAEPGNGAFLFLFYLFLGHLARWLGLPLIIMFHLARLMGAGLLLFMLFRFYKLVFSDNPELFRTAFWLTVVGSGMGWLILALGPLPTDFWVAEAYPFLSMFTNPHFPVGLALMIYSFILLLDDSASFRTGKLLLIGLLMAGIMPFGLVITLLVSIVHTVWMWLETRRMNWLPVVCLGMLGGPYLLYQYWVSQVDPVLAIWNQQNLTPSPPVWDFLLAFTPPLILAPFGIYASIKQQTSPPQKIIIAWLVSGLLLVYFPFSLQRRFMIGYYIPAAALAVFGVSYLRQKYGPRVRALVPLTFGLAVPTNVLLILIGLVGALGHASQLYLTRDEASTLEFIKNNTPAKSLVLASPDMGGLIPGFTGRRVIYGHPFETAYAAEEEQRVIDFYRQTTQVTASTPLIEGRKVDYVLYGPRERIAGGALDLSALSLVFEAGDVQLYAVHGVP